MKNKKKMLIIIIPVIIILAIIATLVVLYFTTDIFKSSDILFWKYFAQNEDIANIIESDKKAEQIHFKSNNNYTSNGNLSLVVEQGENSSKQLNVVTTSRHDVNTNRTYADATLKNGDIDLFKLAYINSDDIYAVNCNEVFQGYVGVKNSGLTELAKNYGIFDFPDSINLNEYKNTLNITNEEWAHISDTYSPVIYNTISKENFTKSSTEIQINNQKYNTKVYTLQLSGDNIKQVIINTLNTLKTDTQTLVMLSNKLSGLGIGIEYTDTSNMVTEINKMIEEMQDLNFDNNMTISVYENEGKTIRTEIILENHIEIVYDKVAEYGKLTIDLAQSAINANSNDFNINVTNNMSDNIITANTNNVNGNITTSNTDNNENQNTSNNNDEIVSMENIESENNIVEQNGNNTVQENVVEQNTENIGDSADMSEVIDLDKINDTRSRIEITKNSNEAATITTIDVIPYTDSPDEGINITINMGQVQNNSINNSYMIDVSVLNGEQINTTTLTYDTTITSAEQVEEIPELTGSNTAIANNYDTNTFNTFISNWSNMVLMKLMEKLAILGF